MAKIWANSGDSHALEPLDLWERALPARLAERAPRVERKDNRETVYVDGQIMRRDPLSFAEAIRPPGAEDVTIRLVDLDDQGIWGEVVFPSRGFWIHNMTDPELARASAAAYNDWAAGTLIAASPRLLPAAITSVLDTGDAVAELARARELGFQAVYMPATPPPDRPYNSEVWEPLWALADESRTPLCFHIGTGMMPQVISRGPGGSVINYVETFFPGQRVVAHLVASGALDRHPGLRIFVAEAGAAWIPALADRMEEGYRQHDMFVRPKLARSPREIVYSQVYTSFQHDPSALLAVSALGYDKVMWGSDYPHLEGTFPNTQKVLHELFDDVDPAVRDRVLGGAFAELFDVPPMPAQAA
ncbi:MULTISPECIES: amidohydrolase family protein [unclassified Pseudofrankia]|uniref:amidohydrolase family protein n=1 Tax=unclassified Pseudofrankia TaxID=2994372 RepID=UPI0008DA9AFC|nr:MULTISPECIES: amidohydrolase family protein [unclassified Pseudofrankia]MDT3441943.1 amidohydrolase family protein [Pseudofrankia sp. BMG5.37]OHV44582.1 amidohydrolase [Pseudofrankia sp. BMG5.36]